MKLRDEFLLDLSSIRTRVWLKSKDLRIFLLFVDDSFQVRGVEGLYASDGSVLRWITPGRFNYANWNEGC